jgi:trimeric autotransporter adhesin
VVKAQQSLDAASLVSPISGTVESVNLAGGDTVTAGSTSETITIVDWGSYEVSGTLTTAQAEEVKDGQVALIAVDGVTGTFEGKVTRVGPVEDDDSTYSYPVIIALTSPTTEKELADGSTAQVSIDLARASGVVVVPTSAVHTSGSHGSYVYLDRGGQEVRKKVTVGLVGSTYTQVTSGVTQGTVVVLADPSEAVPSSSNDTTSTKRTFGGTTGGFAGPGDFSGGGSGSGGAPSSIGASGLG